MGFFTGTLQEGISTALQQSKLVACFVTDNQEESKTWESDYLTDDTIAALLEKDAVLLRLEAGSQEAGYLAAIFPLPKNPTLVIIKDGKLKEYLSTGTSKDDFLSKVEKALQPGQGIAVHSQSNASTSPVTQTETPTPANIPSAQPTPSPSGANTASPAPEQPEGPSQAQLLTEAERRRQVARKEREEIEKERRRKDKGKMPASQIPKQDEAVKQASQQLAERQRKAREERTRVLKLIADDKAERKARSERQRAERQASISEGGGEATAGGVAAPSSSVMRQHDQCAIQVRLFDGSTIRTRFPVKSTVSQDVRKWIDESRTDGNDPYTLKVILTPLPNKPIDHATEEDQTLGELGLAPSSTLVLTPVDRYSNAYTTMNAGLASPVSRFIAAILAIVMNIVRAIATALGGVGERGRADPVTGHGIPARHGRSESHGQAAASGRDANGRIQGFHNPDDAERDHQLYNGNSVSLHSQPWLPPLGTVITSSS